MKLHTSLTYGQVYNALRTVKDKGKVAQDTGFSSMDSRGSRSHPGAFEVVLGAVSQDSLLPGSKDGNGRVMKQRRARNYSVGDEYLHWAATYEEWGWWMAEIFRLDPDAMFGSKKYPDYANAAHFHTKTEGKFKETA